MLGKRPGAGAALVGAAREASAPRGDGHAVLPGAIIMHHSEVTVQSQQPAIPDQIIGHRACSQ
jgi:hypothetical protein